jgi:predicted peroxiredoxin
MNARFDRRYAVKLGASGNATPGLSIMVARGTLDWACPLFIIASTAAVMGWDASLFFTFYGLALQKKCPGSACQPLAILPCP